MTGMPHDQIWRDRKRCDRARRAYDPAFDGLFFTCVRSTRIYCRSICRTTRALSKNVFFVPSAAAAEQLGYRPCLHCRPESAPGSPAWRGTATTVARAVRLIEAGFLENHTVTDLADRLGVGPRHLARLFQRHVGATPAAMAGTRRLQIAKQLITDTNRPLSEIAFEAGFSSIRRFNDAFRKLYRRAPSSFRRARVGKR